MKGLTANILAAKDLSRMNVKDKSRKNTEEDVKQGIIAEDLVMANLVPEHLIAIVE